MCLKIRYDIESCKLLEFWRHVNKALLSPACLDMWLAFYLSNKFATGATIVIYLNLRQYVVNFPIRD
jgi:hypothetical protein